MTNFDDFKFAVEALSGGRNTVILDDLGMPSVMVAFPRFFSSELSSNLAQTVHPAFFVKGEEQEVAYVSKFQNIVHAGRAYSLPLRDPSGCISYDDAMKVSRAKGLGWGLIPAALWSAVALWCKQNGTQPRGNNWNGRDYIHSQERGIVTYREGGKACRIASGSGPVTWNHDGTPDGIADLYGNVSEWNAGIRLVRGEIQIIPQADVILPDTEITESSTAWRAVRQDGALVDPGSDDTLKLDYQDGKWKISKVIRDAADDTRWGLFREMMYDQEELPGGIPQLLKELTLFPADAEGYLEDYIYANNFQEERICLRGGNWTSANHGGVFYSAMDAKRNRVLPRLGFRSAYYSIKSKKRSDE